MRLTMTKAIAVAALVGAAALAATPASARPWRHHHHGWWGPAAGFAAGAIIGGALAARPYYYAPAPVYVEPYPADDEIAYCSQRFKSYDPASGTYLGYDGLRHPCP
jgi:hypothetical protein